MTDPDLPFGPERLAVLLGDGDREAAVVALERLGAADPDTRKRVLRGIRDAAEANPRSFEAVVGPLAGFLTDTDRAVRLTVAKLFVALAASEPDVVVPAVDSLAGRLADEEEFSYVRARCAEALGYVALESPGAVSDPETLADLRVGLSFDEPAVREKLAKALAHVALGDPGRLRHHVSSLADHLGDDSDLVRYNVGTALVAVGCEHPERLSGVGDDLRARASDDSPHVRGRAAEALAVLAESDEVTAPVPASEAFEPASDDSPSFLSRRVAFLRYAGGATRGGASRPDGVGTVESVRRSSEDATEAVASRGEETCSQCGLVLPGGGPPLCPRCGTPQ